MKPAILSLLLCALLLPACATQDHCISFPATRAVMDAGALPLANVSNEGELYALAAVCGIIVGIDMILGIYTFPHDIALLLSRLPAASGDRRPEDELPWHLRRAIPRE